MSRHPSSFNRRGRARGRRAPSPDSFVVETDLPDAIPIGANEIAAVERLLGTELDALLALWPSEKRGRGHEPE